MHTDRQRQIEEELAEHTATSPEFDNVDGLGDALVVPRAPDEELRTSEEILEGCLAA